MDRLCYAIDQRAGLQPARYRGDRLFALRCGELINEEEQNPDGVHQAPTGGNGGLQPGAIDDHTAFGTQNRWNELGICGEVHFDHGIDAAFARELHNPRADVLLLVVDGVVGAGLAGNRRLARRRDGGDDGRARRFGELDGILAYGTCAAGNVQGHAFSRLRQPDGMKCRHCRNAETSAGLKAYGIGQFHRLRRRQRDVFGGGAVWALPLSVPHPHTFAETRSRYAVTDLVDHAGAVAMWNDTRPGDFASCALAGFHVGWIDPGCRQLHPHFTRSGVRRIDFANAQNLPRRTIALVISCQHEASARNNITDRRRWNSERHDPTCQTVANGATNGSAAFISLRNRYVEIDDAISRL